MEDEVQTEEVQEEEEQSSRAQQAGEAVRRLGEQAGAGLSRLGAGLAATPGPARVSPSGIFAVPSAPTESAAENDLADLFEVPQPEDHDIYAEDLLELDPEEGVEDLLYVSRDDIMFGDRAKPKPRITPQRTSTPFVPPKVHSLRVL